MNVFAILVLLGNIAITIFWMYVALQALGALRQIVATLRRIANTQEQIEKKLPNERV